MSTLEYTPIKGLSIIAESINDSVPSTKAFFDADDIPALQNLAQKQAGKGAKYIDINVGSREPKYMAHLISKIQDVVNLPISIDSPDFETQKAGLEAYSLEKSNGAKPIVNSISELRLEILDLYSITKFIPILMATERRNINGVAEANKTGKDIYSTTKSMVTLCKKESINIPNNEIIVDPGIAPIGADAEGMLSIMLDGMSKIHADDSLKGIHLSVGLSNFSVMLPSKTESGQWVKTPLESAYLTMAIPLGLDHVIGNVNKKYRILKEDHPAYVTVNEAKTLGGFDSIIRVQEFIKS